MFFIGQSFKPNPIFSVRALSASIKITKNNLVLY